MDSWLHRIERDLVERGLIPPGQPVLIAVSGGLDSMVLLHVLVQLASHHGWKLTIAHFNHQLRGRSSDADERFVVKTAERLGLPVEVGAGDVKELARASKTSLEMAAREARHRFFAKVAAERKIPAVALAHHADDQVELFFLRLLRGAGSRGLSGMKEVAPSPADATLRLVRPLLGETRLAILRFATRQKIKYREDATNQSLDFQRNRIRHELLPLLTQYQPALVSTILRSMEIVSAESQCVDEMAAAFLKSEQPAFRRLHIAVQRRVLQLQLQHLGHVTDFGLIEQLRENPGQRFVIGPGLHVHRTDRGHVALHPIEELEVSNDEVYLDVLRTGGISFGQLTCNWRVERCAGLERCGERNCEVFDAKKVGSQVVLRHWRPGDRYQPIGMPSAVKLQDLFTNAKVPRGERHRKVVAATAAGEIFWVEGLRISERFKLDSGTRHRLKWCWKPI